MAAVTKVSPILVSPVGYEKVQHGYASADFAAGDLVLISGTPPDSRHDCAYTAAAAATADGIVLKPCKSGGTVEVAYAGEMDGFSGLTRGAKLTVASGVIDSTAPAAYSSYTLTAVTPTRIRFNFG